MKKFCHIPEEWGSFVQVKVNFVDRLKAALRKSKHGCVTLSSVTDPYQPLERKYRLTRSCLELLADTDLAINILTKSDLVLRDLDILKKLPQVKVGLTITTLDPYTAKILEPGAPLPENRLHALDRLTAAGVKTWVFISPVVPGLADTDENLASILKKAAAAGVQEVHYDPLNFYPAAVSNLRAVIQRHWPKLRLLFEAACRDPYYYKEQLRSMADEIWPVYGYDSNLTP
jgi:DNA repair photolyase